MRDYIIRKLKDRKTTLKHKLLMSNELNYDKALVLEKQIEYIDKELKHLETQRIKEKYNN